MKHADQTTLLAIQDLARRVLGAEPARRFVFSLIDGEAGRDTYELEAIGDRIAIAGSSGPALAMGLHGYLKHHAGLHYSWYGSRLELPAVLPAPCGRERHTCWAEHRYFLNYCCFSYSLAFWDWAQWEPLIDWMALNGINRPLAITGLEAVWQRVCRRLGITEEQTRAFIAGAAYLPFGWMGCLDGWGGPLPADWCEQHEQLGLQILGRERELGMTPVLQGFTGHVPRAFLDSHPEARTETIHWHEWTTHLLDPLDPHFPRVAAIFAEEQARSFGTDHYYAADTFIEMTPPSGDPAYLANLGRALYEGMRASDPDALWVLQGWAFMDKRTFWTQPRIEAFLGGAPDDRVLVLDLHCEDRPMWNQTRAFAGKPWLWCNVQNFGRNTQLTAALAANNEGLMQARRDAGRGRLAGIGMVSEGLCYNPVAYDFLFEQAWRDRAVDLEHWIHAYMRHRYGADHPSARQAWSLLRKAVYNDFQPERSEHLRKPSEQVTAVATPRDGSLETAWELLLDAAPAFGRVDAYLFDLVNLGRQVLSNRATLIKSAMRGALAAGRAGDFARLGGEIERVLLDMDELVGARVEFLLGPWLADARRWGKDDAEKALMELGARRQITIWGHTHILRDYARKEWAGLLRDFHVPRWKAYTAAGLAALASGQPLDPAAFECALLEWERQWIAGQEEYTTTPCGNAVEITRRLLPLYQTPFRGTDEQH